MSVMAETTQVAIRPYVAIAAVGLESYARTADCREVLVVKVYAAGEGLGGEGLGGGGLGGGSGGGEGDSDGAGGLGGGSGGGEGEGGGEGSPQQASLQFAESDFFFFVVVEHNPMHFCFLFGGMHHFVTFFRSHFLHVFLSFLSLSAVQFFGDGAEAKSTGNHCGGTALISDWRAWAVELGLDEMNGVMVLVPVVPTSTRPCQLWKGVVRSPGWWNADRWTCVIMGRRPELHEVCKRSMHAAKNRGGHRDSVCLPERRDRAGLRLRVATGTR